MRILAIETGCPPGSVALLDDEQLIAETHLGDSQRTVQTLFPEIHHLLQSAGWRARDVELIGVTVGPGSFTGLRIGVTVAKTWAFATRALVVGLPTFETIAAQAETQRNTLWAIMDAQRRQLFAARYERSAVGEPWHAAGDVRIVARDHWLSQLNESCAVTGPGLTTIVEQLEPLAEQQAPGAAGLEILPPGQWIPRAVTTGKLAFAHHREGRHDDFLRLAPYYCRRSAAEEKRGV